MNKLFYLYGIIDSAESFTLTLPEAGREIFNLADNGLGMVVSRAGGWEAGLLSENLYAHNAVMEYLLEHYTVLPVRYGTIVAGEKEITDLINCYGGEFKRQLHRFRGKVEMGVKVLWNIEQEQKEYRESETSGVSIIQEPGSGSPGHRYLLNKYQEKAPQMQLRRKAEQAAALIHNPLAARSEEACRSILRTPALMFSGAYLLDRRNVDGFRAEYQHLKKNLPKYKFLLSGPWPAFSFANINCMAGSE
ncbi:MAG: GvpL/GvpF family gas vesicle protein [Desulfotomaculaceae bacterium]